MRLPQFVPALVIAALAAPLVLAQSAPPPDRSMCRSLCERDKEQCRKGTAPLDAAATAAWIGSVAAVVGQPKAFEGTAAMDAKRDMRDVLSDKQRAAADTKSAAREWEDKCNQTYLQCLGTCASAPVPGEGKDAGPTR